MFGHCGDDLVTVVTVVGIYFYRPDQWMDVFTVIPVICFGYQVSRHLRKLNAEKRSMMVVNLWIILWLDAHYCMLISCSCTSSDVWTLNNNFTFHESIKGADSRES